MIIWLVGLSGAGKTTVGREVVRQWKRSAPNTVLVDGDEIRALYKHDQRPGSHTVEGRRDNAERITALCHWLDGQGINAVVCILSIFPEMRAENRMRFSQYFEVYLKVPLPALQARDEKGLYGKAARGEMTHVVGIDIPFPEPETADLVVDNTPGAAAPENLARRILEGAGVLK
ncbi:Adenylyl-sulfate kinase [Magnetospirillum gryphiswaldense MSR-1 v2]|uniref:Adenylyl-sulfate kinase n=1 Tax=Magnetospirillum gryphiswaldense (strain DSM 6361 / JCM 21280 / NBRC 15271 / MSR-1) TaxID=431944 RepID=V6F8A4_MAGGM|nr:adenylyl-sulfate kinase [Magnetospirillum gryphiswaldense]CDL00646.1 Adenylyl-sulfate kinase [Magnetospirillum gryphiswaldense MSR-1 v2]